jgi:hypothetical protein
MLQISWKKKPLNITLEVEPKQIAYFLKNIKAVIGTLKTLEGNVDVEERVRAGRGNHNS